MSNLQIEEGEHRHDFFVSEFYLFAERSSLKTFEDGSVGGRVVCDSRNVDPFLGYAVKGSRRSASFGIGAASMLTLEIASNHDSANNEDES